MNAPRILRAGLDAATIGMEGALDPDLAERIAKAREGQHAQELAGETPAPVLIEVAGRAMRLWPNSRKRNLPFQVSDGDVTISLRMGREPLALVRLGSRLCATLPDVELRRLLLRLVKAVMPTPKRAWLSNLHLACDFQGWQPPMRDPSSYVGRACRSARTEWRRQGDDATDQAVAIMSGYGSKRRADVRARIEDKTHEIAEHSKKLWWHDIWAACPGYDPAEPVYRLEIQAERGLLREASVDGTRLDKLKVGDALKHVGALWRYALRSWLRLTVPSDSPQRTRWPTHPAWARLAGAPFGDGPVIDRRPFRAQEAEELVERAQQAARRVENASVGFVAAAVAAAGADIAVITDADLAAAVAYAPGWWLVETGRQATKVSTLRLADRVRDRHGRLRLLGDSTADERFQLGGSDVGVALIPAGPWRHVPRPELRRAA